MTQDRREAALNDYLVRFLLRYFRRAQDVGVAQPDFDAERDVDLLRMHWAVSEGVRGLVDHLSQHRHEIQAVLRSRPRQDDARVRGRFDARATLIRRLVTGLPTMIVSHEAVRTLESGPNHVLTWVLETAWRLGLRFEDLLPEDATYRAAIERTTPGLETIRRFDAVHQAAKSIDLTRRPGPQAVKEASRSRRQIYVLASRAYRALQSIEAGDADAIAALLNDTLLGPLHLWQRFELAVGLGVVKALSEAASEQFALGFLGGGAEPIGRVAGYQVHWQSPTRAYRQPLAEPSEALTASLLKHYGLSLGTDRPDLVVLDGEGAAVAVVEVKYFSSEENDGADALRGAVGQLVRYARCYRAMPQVEDLLDHSIVAVVRHEAGSVPDPKPYGLPLIVDFEDLIQLRLQPWAQRLVAAGEAQRSAWRVAG